MRKRVVLIATGAAALLAFQGGVATGTRVSAPAVRTAPATIVAPAVVRATAVTLAASSKVTMTVDATVGTHAISPLVYGVNFANQVSGLNKAFAVPVNRWGGNSTSRYNYLNQTYNTGADWYYENISHDSDMNLTGQVASDRANKTASLVTVPMIGWVSKDSPSEHPYLCSFPRTTFATQDSFDYWDDNCGNGEKDNKPLSGADPTITSTAVGAEFDQAMVTSLVNTYGTAANGGVKFYELDNEPAAWNSTHRDVHPDPLTSDELWAKSLAAAQAVKAADPTAAILGPSDWGWCAYYFSAADSCGESTTDQAAHGGIPIGEWYLQQFKASDDATGTRLLDYFDEHFYPQGSGIALGTAGNAATKAKRLRSTRSLWDPTYVDESWISDVTQTPLQWIPTMKKWVAENYPGTKTAITEYNWGGLESMNGALAQADVLGIFGREGLDLATLWGPTKASDPWAYAFRMYRNYDGKQGAFGDTSVKAASSSQGKLAVYAATRTKDGALTIMVINKTGSSIRSTITLKHFSAASKAKLYRYSSTHLKTIVVGTSAKRSGSKLTTSYPANSITLLVLPKH